MRQKRIVLLVIFIFLILIIGYYIYINIFYFKNSENEAYSGKEIAKEKIAKEDDAPIISIEKGKKEKAKNEEKKQINEDIEFIDPKEEKAVTAKDTANEDMTNEQEKIIKTTKSDDKKDSKLTKSVLVMKNEVQPEKDEGINEKNADYFPDNAVIEENVSAADNEVKIVKAEKVIIQEPSKDEYNNIKEQIDEKDREEGEKIASKIDISLINEYLKDGVTAEEKRKIESHLRQNLSASEYERAKELVNKYIHLLDE